MELVKRNKTKKTIEDDRKRILSQWGVIVFIAVVVLITIVVNYFVNSKKDAVNNVQDRLITQSAASASSIERIMAVNTASASAVAAIMGDKDKSTDADIIWYAKELKKAQPDCYMVIIANNKGEGYSSDGVKVDISDNDYFSISRSQRYCVTLDDGVFNRKAYVSAVPYYQDNISEGNIYMFVATDKITEHLQTVGYDMKDSFAICDSKGTLISSFGEKTGFLKDNKFMENLSKATLIDTDWKRVTGQLSRQAKFVFSAELNGEEKTIISVPLGISDWQYLTILESAYVDRQISKGWSNVRSLTMSFGIIVISFIVVAVVVVLVNRIHYNQRNKELADKADTDLLTELCNKMATERKIQEYIDANPNSQCLFFLFDIDNFKKINDTLGHAFGDEVLRSLGQQLRNEFRVTDIIGRTGGDEFILFLKDLNSDDVLEKEAKRLENLFHQFKAGEYVKYSATASIGATVFPRDAKDYQGLYKTADSALYEAKRRGKNCLVFYNKELKEVNPEKKKETPIESDMR